PFPVETMRREKRETQPAFCPIQSARKSTHAGRIEWQANHAFVVRSANRMFVRTTGRHRDEIGRTAWKTRSGTSNLDGVARKKRDAKKVDRLLRRRCRSVKANNFFPCSASKIRRQGRTNQRVEDNAFHPRS